VPILLLLLIGLASRQQLLHPCVLLRLRRAQPLKEAQRRCRYRSAAFTAATPSAAAAPPQLFQQHALHLVEAPREPYRLQDRVKRMLPKVQADALERPFWRQQSAFQTALGAYVLVRCVGGCQQCALLEQGRVPSQRSDHRFERSVAK
jgi:hypothetical protein